MTKPRIKRRIPRCRPSLKPHHTTPRPQKRFPMTLRPSMVLWNRMWKRSRPIPPRRWIVSSPSNRLQDLQTVFLLGVVSWFPQVMWLILLLIIILFELWEFWDQNYMYYASERNCKCLNGGPRGSTSICHFFGKILKLFNWFCLGTRWKAFRKEGIHSCMSLSRSIFVIFPWRVCAFVLTTNVRNINESVEIIEWIFIPTPLKCIVWAWRCVSLPLEGLPSTRGHPAHVQSVIIFVKHCNSLQPFEIQLGLRSVHKTFYRRLTGFFVSFVLSFILACIILYLVLNCNLHFIVPCMLFVLSTSIILVLPLFSLISHTSHTFLARGHSCLSIDILHTFVHEYCDAFKCEITEPFILHFLKTIPQTYASLCFIDF